MSCFDQRLTSRFLSSGVAIGAGFQGTVAFINIGSYYVFGVPLALLLGYVADLQVKVRTHYSTFTDYQIITLLIILLPSDLVSERS
jgi:MATE family multidrug resistance protein